MPKCSTSALYSLFELHPATVTFARKEFCFNGDLKEYFKTMAHMQGSKGTVAVNGCLYIDCNINIRKILREPNTFYVVSIIYTALRYDQYIMYKVLYSMLALAVDASEGCLRLAVGCL